MKRSLTAISLTVLTACALPVMLRAAETKPAEVRDPEVKEAGTKPEEPRHEESAAAAKALWLTDFEAAKARAKETGRPIFALFTGSDWCSWCVVLHDEVLVKSEFVKYAGEALVLFEADFPRKKKIAEALRKQNQALATQYSVRGFPTVLILDAEGVKVAETGYQEGGPVVYVEHLKALLKSKK